jgi:hypothetical protein
VQKVGELSKSNMSSKNGLKVEEKLKNVTFDLTHLTSQYLGTTFSNIARDGKPYH